MQCLKCEKETLVGKALCQDCFDVSTQLKKSQLRDWEDRRAVNTEFTTARTLHIRSVPSASSTNSSNAEEHSDATSMEAQQIVLPGHWARFLSYNCDSCLSYLLIILMQAIGLAICDISLAELNLIFDIDSQGWQLIDFTFHRKTISDLMTVSTVSYVFGTIIYFVGFESSRWRRTPGKMLLGLSIIPLVESTLTLSALSKRFVVKCSWLLFIIVMCNLFRLLPLPSLTLLLMLLLLAFASILLTFADHISVYFTGNRQALHDKYAGTLVVKTEDMGTLGIITTILITLLSLALSFLMIISYE